MKASAFVPIGEFNARQCTAPSPYAPPRTTADTPPPSPRLHHNHRKRLCDTSDDGSRSHHRPHESATSPSSSSPNMDIIPRAGPELFNLSCQAPIDHRTILKTLVKKEKTQMPDPHYMTTVQSSLKPLMTAILYGWLIDVCSSDCLDFSRSTLDAAIRNVERFLSKHAIVSSLFQCVGAACLLIAYKFNERKQDKIVDFIVEFGGDAYTKDELLLMERTIAIALNWNLMPVTSHDILEILVDAEDEEMTSTASSNEPIVKRRRCNAASSRITMKTDKAAHCMMLDVILVAQSKYAFLGYPPSVHAAGAYCFAKRNQIGKQEAFFQALSFTKEFLDVTDSKVIAFVKQLETCGPSEEDKTRAATPQSVDADVFG